MIERFDEYVDRCLYDPEAGFYARHGEAGGARGDFVTSPEVGPLFGTVIARYLDSVWHDLGEPERFTVVEAAAGRGALAKAILSAGPTLGPALGPARRLACAEALDYVTVERSDRLRQAQRELLGDAVTICATLDEVRDGEPFVGVVLANELLDNLAFRLLVRGDTGWDEVFVDDGVPVVDELGAPVSVDLPAAPPGSRFPVCTQARTWVRQALDRLTGGRLLVIDYGVVDGAELVSRDWLRTYRGHTRGGDPFEASGHADITCDVPYDQLPDGATVMTQAEFLERWGISDLVDDGRRIWQERAHLGDLAAIRARSRITESEALLDPDGLGAFLVAEWIVG